jgi:hypothetical protein
MWSTRGGALRRVLWRLLLRVSVSTATIGANRSGTERRRASAVIDVHQILPNRGKGKYADVRQIKWSLGVPRRDSGVTLFHRNRYFTAADKRSSGEEFLQSCGDLRRGKEEGRRRGVQDT